MDDDRPDLGAMLHQLARAVAERELHLLSERDVQMWDYVVLSRLRHGPAATQLQLAQTSGRDKTRLIPLLDRLEERRLVVRTPDPRDRRNRVVSLTAQGRQVVDDCREAIRGLEEELLADLRPRERSSFLAVLQRLSAAVSATQG